MPKERKPGWIYCFSKTLEEEFAFHKKTGWVYFERGAKYSPEEIKMIKENGGTIDFETHKIKTVMKGEIVKYDRIGTDDKGKSAESSTGNNKSIDLNPGGKISETAGTAKKDESELFDIY